MDTSNVKMCRALIEVMGGFKSQMHNLAAEQNLTFPQMMVLYDLYKNQSSMGALAHRMRCDASNITGIVDKLVSQRFLTRSEASNDRRVKQLDITPAGRTVVEKIITELAHSGGIQSLNAQEEIGFSHCLSKLMAKTDYIESNFYKKTARQSKIS
jgi:DNA-binding MarR family transcriptional regulator